MYTVHKVISNNFYSDLAISILILYLAISAITLFITLMKIDEYRFRVLTIIIIAYLFTGLAAANFIFPPYIHILPKHPL